MVRLPEPEPNLKHESWTNALELSWRPDVAKVIQEVNDKYLHWDKFRFYDVPPGLTKEQVWAAIQLSRSPPTLNLLPIRFTDKKVNDKIAYWIPPQQQEWLHILDQKAGGNVGLDSQFGIRDHDDHYLIGSLMEEAIASSQLEGASTTRKVAKKILESGRKPRDRSERMIVNNYRAILEIRNLKNVSLTSDLIVHLQTILTKDTLDDPDHSGRFRRTEDDIVVADTGSDTILHVPPDAGTVAARIEELCAFANDGGKPFIHPVIKAIAIHFAIGYIHPFCDGNGRTARALFYWYMLKKGYWLFEYLPISRVILKQPVQYARAYLYTECSNGDLTYFTHYNLKVIDRAIGELHRYLDRKKVEIKEVTAALDNHPDLNFRQIELLSDAVKHSGSPTSIRMHARRFRISYGTARTDLLDLEAKGFLLQRKLKKRLYFFPHDDLVKKIGKPIKGPGPVDLF